MNHELPPTRKMRGVRCFASVVRSPDHVRAVFDSQGQYLVKVWWKLVLGLHGRPVRNLTPMALEEERGCIADGFHFYGILYRLVALMLFVAFLGAMVFGVTGFYGLGILGGSAAYLWITANLAIDGARLYRAGIPQGRALLVEFLFFVAAFLTGFIAMAGAVAHQHGLLPDAVNVLFLASFLVVGVGSYVIELVFLVGPAAPASGTAGES